MPDTAEQESALQEGQNNCFSGGASKGDEGWGGEVTRKAKLPGLLVPTAGMLNLSAPQAGVVAALLVKEGELVQAGQVLLRLKTE